MILDNLKSDMLQARKDRNDLKLSVLNFLISAIKYKEVELRGQSLELNDDQIEKVLRKQIKQRNQSIEAYTAGKRLDLANKEIAEKEVLEGILNAYFGQ
ncbi:GatB/YqeY domain-containing protein [candidate division WWE3 bacterium]|nr:GatB/YqeY domain-containing protein [candidate division WWE3 bacterium]